MKKSNDNGTLTVAMSSDGKRGLPETPVTHVDRSVKFRDLPNSRQVRLDELTVKVFWNEAHPLNAVLTREFGYLDEGVGQRRYSPSMADVRAHLIALEKSGKIPSFGPESPQEREARIKHLLKDTRVRPPKKRM